MTCHMLQISPTPPISPSLSSPQLRTNPPICRSTSSETRRRSTLYKQAYLTPPHLPQPPSPALDHATSINKPRKANPKDSIAALARPREYPVREAHTGSKRSSLLYRKGWRKNLSLLFLAPSTTQEGQQYHEILLQTAKYGHGLQWWWE